MATNVVKASYWLSDGGFPAAGIDSPLFTHLFYAFADLDPQTFQVTVASWNQTKLSAFTPTVQQRNPNVKTLLSIGGDGNATAAAFASMASNPWSRTSFIDSSIALARSNGFHGLDLDWEYPSNAVEMSNLGTLLREWRSAVAAEARGSGKPPLLLTAAVFYSSNRYGVDYPVQAVANNLDWVNLMAYDFYGPGWSNVTGPPGALYPPNAGPSGDTGVKAWIQGGVPAKKLVLGFPYYGWAWQLENAQNHGYFAPTTGRAVTPDGAMVYGQVRRFIADNGVVPVHDPAVVGDYVYVGTTWIGYDEISTIATKVRYAKQKGLLGYMSWHVGGDDNFALSRTASQTWDATVSDV
ncbi:PREDICTED: chitotriosidase-1-like [Tarenaya hassleriana]|uniref:chitotriosidase-1-like n=1 Tax=Tarenaya hassleriana TaxID=28532 RepID=UPI00053C9EDF|nr:PREDICTED: chitotriosidase-1-like [Tarenaya hassleriana]